jgi:hypothetical protein
MKQESMHSFNLEYMYVINNDAVNQSRGLNGCNDFLFFMIVFSVQTTGRKYCGTQFIGWMAKDDK